jgi:hypothetical protein
MCMSYQMLNFVKSTPLRGGMVLSLVTDAPCMLTIARQLDGLWSP